MFCKSVIKYVTIFVVDSFIHNSTAKEDEEDVWTSGLQNRGRGDAEAAAKLKSIKEALLLIAQGSAKRKRF